MLFIDRYLGSKKLIAAFKAGDKQVIQELYDQLFPALKHWLKQNSGSKEDAEDVFQEAMVAAYRKLREPAFHLNHELPTYIFAIAKKLWLQKLRRQGVHSKYEQFLSTQSKVEDLEGVIEEQESLELYRHYFNKLDEACKKLLTFVFQGKSMLEIKEQFGFNNEAHARKKKFRCKNELINMIRKDKRYLELKKQ